MIYTPQTAIDRLRALPDELEALVGGLTDADLDHVLPGEWTVRQIVHHLADSHMSAVFRFKLPLTEDSPRFMTYDQDAFADLADYRMPIAPSMDILRGLHARFVALLSALTEEQWTRQGVHAEWGPLPVSEVAARYARHCDNHIEQINRVLASRPSA